MRLNGIKAIGLNFTILIFTITLILFLAEGLSRLLFKRDLPHMVSAEGTYQPFFVSDEELVKVGSKNFRGKLISAEYRNAIKTNNLGFRADIDYNPEKDGRFRIMILGDSFTFGQGVEKEQVYSSVLGRMIENKLGIKTECMNMGVIGYGTLQEIKVFRKYSHFNPDLVILGSYIRDTFGSEGGNDLVDNYRYAVKHKKWKVSTNGHLPKASSKDLSLPRRIRGFLKKNSNLYRNIELMLGGVIRKYYKPKDNLKLKEKAWEITLSALTEFDKELQEDGIKCLLYWIPFPQAVTTNNHSVAERIDALELQNIILVDPVQEMGPDPMQYYYRLDSHWNEKGHDLAANLLFDSILKNDILNVNQIKTQTN